MFCNESTATSTLSCESPVVNTLVIFSDVQKTAFFFFFFSTAKFFKLLLAVWDARWIGKTKIENILPKIKSAASCLVWEMLRFTQCFEERSSLIARLLERFFKKFAQPCLSAVCGWLPSLSTDVSQENLLTRAQFHVICLFGIIYTFVFYPKMHKCLFNEQLYFIIYSALPSCLILS